jgi:hypothetical protein
MALLETSRQHVVKTTAECHSADDVRDGIANGYPATAASMWGMARGRERCEVVDGVLLGRHTGEWAHQMSIQAWWDHTSLGEIFYVMNQWGKGTHGIDPAGGPPGGFWIEKADMDWICRNGEVFAFSGLAGFPARRVPWDGSRF